MLRLFRTYIEYALIHILWCHSQGLSVSQMRKEILETYGRYNNTPDEHVLSMGVGQAYTHFTGALLPMNVATDLARTLISDQKSGSQDVEIISKLVKALQLPYPRNVLSGETIKSIQKALLLPEEMVGLSARLDKQELSCASCGHTFLHGEMTSIVVDANGRNILQCTTCFIPEQIACRSCRVNHTKVYEKLGSFIKASQTCEKCSGKEVTTQSSTAAKKKFKQAIFGGDRGALGPFREDVILQDGIMDQGQGGRAGAEIEINPEFAAPAPPQDRVEYPPDPVPDVVARHRNRNRAVDENRYRGLQDAVPPVVGIEDLIFRRRNPEPPQYRQAPLPANPHVWLDEPRIGIGDDPEDDGMPHDPE